MHGEVRPGCGCQRGPVTSAEVVEGWLKEEEEEQRTPLLVWERLEASVTVGLVRVLGAHLGRRRVSHGALGLGGTLDIALITKAGAGVLMGEEKTQE